jgi:hypothetical protein
MVLTLTGEILLTVDDAVAGNDDGIALPTQSEWANFIDSHRQKSAEFEKAYMRFIHAEESDELPDGRDNEATPMTPYVLPPTCSTSIPSQAASPASLYDDTDTLPGVPRVQEFLRNLDEAIITFLRRPIGYWNPSPEMNTSTQNFYRGRLSSFQNSANLLLTGLPPERKSNSSVEDLFGSERFR